MSSKETGVGTITHSFFEAFDAVVAGSAMAPDYRFSLYAIAPRLKTSAPGFSRAVYERCSAQCHRHGGQVLFMQTLSDGEDFQHSWDGGDRSRTIEHWTRCSQQVAAAAENLANDYSTVLVFLHDVPFVSVRKHLSARAENIFTIYIPHSLGTSFSDLFSKERDLFEADGFSNFEPGKDYIGFVSRSIKRSLVEHYGFDDSSLLPFINGINVSSHRPRADASDPRPPIPDNRKLIFSWGRLSSQKGYDLLIPAVAKFLSEPQGRDYYFVMIAPCGSAGGEYFANISEQLARIPKRQRFVCFEYSSTLPFEILRHQNLRVVALPSRFESFGLTAVEAGLLANPNAHIVYSPIETFREFFAGQAGCHALDDMSCESVYRALTSIAGPAGVGDRAPMADGHDFAKNYSAGLDGFLSRLSVVA